MKLLEKITESLYSNWADKTTAQKLEANKIYTLIMYSDITTDIFDQQVSCPKNKIAIKG